MKAIVAYALVAAVMTTSNHVVSGAFVSFGADARGMIVHIDEQGTTRSLRVAPGARIRERARDEDWRAINVGSLKAGEPIVAMLDARGRATAIDAEYDRVATRIVVVAEGYIVTTSGATYRLVGPAASQVAGVPLGIYAVLRVNSTGGTVFDLVTSKTRLNIRGEPAQPVTVTFVVRVPVNTPPNDGVYLATNSQNWTPNAIRMSPLPGNRWTASLSLTGGTLLAYKYTRGSWTTDERNAAGSEIENRKLEVTSAQSSQTVNDAVARWADLSS